MLGAGIKFEVSSLLLGFANLNLRAGSSLVKSRLFSPPLYLGYPVVVRTDEPPLPLPLQDFIRFRSTDDSGRMELRFTTGSES